jgi:hypothetical protein
MGKIDPETKAEWAEARRRLEEMLERNERARRAAWERAEKRRLRLQRLSFGLLGRNAQPYPELDPDPKRALQATLDRHDRAREEWRQRIERRRQRLNRLSFGLLGRHAEAENSQAA